MTVHHRATARGERAAGPCSGEIADRRRADLARRARGHAPCASWVARPRPAPSRDRWRSGWRGPGLHVIAEIKRRSPSAGSLSDGPLDVADRARAYAAGGASMISVLVEPHWFGGSIDDLRGGPRGHVSLPVLAKEFVVDPRQLPILRAAGADAVLLLAALHPAPRLGAPRRGGRSTWAWSRSSRSTTRASWMPR